MFYETRFAGITQWYDSNSRATPVFPGFQPQQTCVTGVINHHNATFFHASHCGVMEERMSCPFIGNSQVCSLSDFSPSPTELCLPCVIQSLRLPEVCVIMMVLFVLRGPAQPCHPCHFVKDAQHCFVDQCNKGVARTNPSRSLSFTLSTV